MVKTAVIGASGYVGRHLWDAYRREFPDCIGTSFSRGGPGLTPLDIRNPDLASLHLVETGHEAVLIASAEPNVSFCERNPSEARAVNVDGTLELARQAERLSLSVVFLSSDYVFEGTGRDYDDGAPTRPTTEYGRQKSEAESLLPSLADDHLILRLSKIYGVGKGDGTLLDEMAALLTAGREVRAAADQFFCPTLVDDLVRVILEIQEGHARGVMNVCSPERWSRHGVATAVAEALGLGPGLVKEISLYDIPSMEGRPLDTSMVCPRLGAGVSSSFTLLREAAEKVAANWADA